MGECMRTCVSACVRACVRVAGASVRLKTCKRASSNRQETMTADYHQTVNNVDGNDLSSACEMPTRDCTDDLPRGLGKRLSVDNVDNILFEIFIKGKGGGRKALPVKRRQEFTQTIFPVATG